MAPAQTELQLDHDTVGSSTPEDDDSIQVVEFRLNGLAFAVPINTVQEIIRFERATPLTGMPDWTIGVINLRGAIVTVHDLAQRVGLRELGTTPPETAKVLVLSCMAQVIGLVVDDVDQVAVFDTDDLLPAPDASDGFIRRIATSGDRLVLLLDVSELAAAL